MSDDKKQERNRTDEASAKREELVQLFKRGAEFSEELLKENERLRFRVVELEAREASGGSDEGLVKELMDKIRRLEAERDEMRARSSEVEAQNRGSWCEWIGCGKTSIDTRVINKINTI